MRPAEITLQPLRRVCPGPHPGQPTYRTAPFCAPPAGRPNSFVALVLVNLDQYAPDEVEAQARFAFYPIAQALAEAAGDRGRPPLGQATSWTANTRPSGAGAIGVSATDGRLGPAAAGKPVLPA